MTIYEIRTLDGASSYTDGVGLSTGPINPAKITAPTFRCEVAYGVFQGSALRDAKEAFEAEETNAVTFNTSAIAYVVEHEVPA